MSERRLRRFFTGTPILAEGEKISLAASETRHIKTTLRLQVGDSCLVTDGSGIEAEAVIIQFPSNGTTELKISCVRATPRVAPTISIFVYPALLQKGKMDDLVRQMQELGVEGFFPIETERTMVKMESQARIKIVERWRKIVQEAAKQSGSLKAMKIGEPRSLKEVLQGIPKSSGTVFHPEGKTLPFADWVKDLKRESNLHLFFGPEGGFSEKEISVFESQGFSKVKLGANILKADTAILGVVSALEFIFV